MAKVGESAVLLYALLTYVPQFLFHMVSDEALAERFRIGSQSQHLALFIAGFLLLVFLLHVLIPRFRIPSSNLAKWIAALFESRFNTLFAVAMLALAVNFYLTEGISFRHTGEHLSEAGIAVQMIMLCKPYVCAWLLYHFVQTIRGQDRNHGRTRLQASLFLVALVVSLTGSLDVLPIMWFAVFALCSRQRLRTLFVVIGRRRPLFLRALMVVVGVPLAAVLIVTMVWIGLVNKLGAEGTTELVERVGVYNLAEQVMVRVSSSYAAAISFAEYNLFNVSVYDSAMDVPLQNVPYRLSLIFGAPLPRPDITQITRLNYLNYENDTHLERAGASPGIVASAFFAAPFPLGYLLMALYVVVVMRIVNMPFRGLNVRLKLATGVLAASFVYPLFETPVDYLVFVDPAFLQLLILAAFVAAASRVDVPAPEVAAPSPAHG